MIAFRALDKITEEIENDLWDLEMVLGPTVLVLGESD